MKESQRGNPARFDAFRNSVKKSSRSPPSLVGRTAIWLPSDC